MTNEMKMYDPGEGDMLPAGQGGLDLMTYRLDVEAKGREQGFRYGGKQGVMLGFDLEMILVAVRMNRMLFGIEKYDRSVELKASNPVVCRSADGVTGRGIARWLTKDEEEQCAGGREFLGWANEIKERPCQDPVSGKAICPCASGELWPCRPRYELIGLLRSPGQDERAAVEWFSPFTWEIKGGSVKPMFAVREAIMRACMTTPWVVTDGEGKEHQKRSPRFRFSSMVSLQSAKTGFAGLYPEFSSPAKLLDDEFERVASSYFAGENAPIKQLVDASVAHDYRQQELLGQPRKKKGAEETSADASSEEAKPDPEPESGDPVKDFDGIPF